MLRTKTICVVVPAYNEEQRIAETLSLIPSFVDEIVVVDDCSKDRTVDIVRTLTRDNARLTLLRHEHNQGVGGAIMTGYQYALGRKYCATAVMAGDNQMNPSELEHLCLPVLEEGYDYVKANRLIYGQAWGKIPKMRYLGNSCLSLLTKIASGYWHVADSQAGYTAIGLDVLQRLPLGDIYKRYGVPNDILVRLNIANARVKEIPSEPIYHVDGKSGIRYHKVFFTIPWLLLKRFFLRLWLKYVIQDFHPLVFFYFFGSVLFPVGMCWGLSLVYYRIAVGPVAATSALFTAFLAIFGLQFLLFGMLFDMENNRQLK